MQLWGEGNEICAATLGEDDAYAGKHRLEPGGKRTGRHKKIGVPMGTTERNRRLGSVYKDPAAMAFAQGPERS